MSIQKVYDNQSEYNLSPEFQQTLSNIKPNVDAMVAADKEFKHHRMIVIGTLVERRTSTPFSDDKKAIREMLNTWSEDVVKNCSTAYKTYKELKGNVNPEFNRLAEEATPTQLMILSRGKDTSILSDAAMALKRDGKVPSQNHLRGHLGGHTNNRFEYNNHKADTTKVIPSVSSHTEVETKPAPEPVPTEFQRQQMINQSFVDNPKYPWITSPGSATVFRNNTSDIIRGLIEKLTDYAVTGSDGRKQALAHLSKLVDDAYAKECLKISQKDTQHLFVK